MKLIIKNLKQVPHEVEVPDTSVTVKDLKVAIEKAHGFDAIHLKLLFNGIVLEDSKTLDSYNIKEDFVIIMMNTKIKPKNVPPSQPEQPKPVEQPKSSEPKPSGVPSTTPQQPPSQPQKDYTKEINTLVEMGFVKSEAEAAIKAARGNVDVAIEFLYSGIPPNLPPEQPLSSSGGQPSASSELKKIASITKVLCSQDPSSLERILMTLQARSPELMELIKQNEEEFKELLSQPITEGDLLTYQELSSHFSGMGSGGGRPQGGNRGVTIHLTQEENEAVKRLIDLGFTQNEVLQAYLACEKNEELAANFLFENKMEEDTHIQQPQAQQPPQQPPQQPQVQQPPQQSPQQPQAQQQQDQPQQEPEKKNDEEKK